MMFELARDYEIYGEVLKQKGDAFKAKENYTKAIQTFSRYGADGWVAQTEQKITEIQ